MPRKTRSDAGQFRCDHPRTPENVMGPYPSKPNGGQCRMCWKTYRASDAGRSATYRYLYGLSIAEYNAMCVAQGNVCAICQRVPRAGKRLWVDHAHDTDKVRSLLCVACNTILGLAQEDFERLSTIQAYLSKHVPREEVV